MSADRLLLAAVWTAYIFVGSYLKDQRLTYYLGDTYREYASRVAGYPGIFFFGPLAKWPRVNNATTLITNGAKRVETNRAA